MLTRRFGWLLLAVFVLAGIWSSPSDAAPPDDSTLPPELSEWVEWVRPVEPEPRECRQVDDEVTLCVWPSALRLDVGPTGASFEMDVSVFGPDTVELPGDEQQWPQDVELDGKTGAVLLEGETPRVELDEGRHTLTGFIPWREAPDSLRIPTQIGLIDLVVGGTTIPFPSRGGGTLSLEGSVLEDEVEPDEPGEEVPEEPAQDVPDSETLEVSRRLVDGVPLTVMTRVDVHITGKAREFVLPNPTLEGSTLVQVTAPVPVTMGENGSLVLQVRPGTLTLDLVAALPRSPESLSPPEHPAPWPDDEVWVWNAAESGAPSMGQVSLSGAQPVDLARTHAPSEWQGGATYRLDPKGALRFEVIQRGVSETSTNQLVLRRQMRVDLAGTGWTIIDDIGGEMNRGNRMDLHQEQGVLGSVATNGKPQVITVTDDGHSGVEVRGPALGMRAQWRIEGGTSTLPLGGWSEEFDSVDLSFTLPRGWDVLYAQGPGSLGPTWFGAWRPLDLISLLGVVLLVGRFIGPIAGVTALLGLGLAYTRNGDGYLMLLALVATTTVLVIPLRRQHTKGVALGLRAVWAVAAFMIGAWVIWRMPASVTGVWRGGLSGLAHIRLEHELETMAKLAMTLVVVGAIVLGLAVLTARANKGLARLVVLSVVGVVGFGLMASWLLMAAPGGSRSDDATAVDFTEVGARQEALAAAPEPEPMEEEEWEEDGDYEQRNKGEEGRMGKPTSKQKSGLYAMKGPKQDLSRFASSNNDEDVWGGLTGSEVGEAYGVGGLGLVGTGRGGGGTGEGTIGLGNTGLIGKGAGGGEDSGYGRGSGAGFGGKGKRVPKVRQGKAQVRGELDRDIVRRIVRAHINEVRHCYNRGLSEDPSLQGKATVEFVIAGSGKVSSSTLQDTSLSDRTVGECIAKAVQRWKFPKPSGGGTVTVAYPFVLSSDGDGPSSDAPAPPPEERFIAKNVPLPQLEAPAVPQTGDGVPEWSGPEWTMSLDRTVKSDESVTLWLVTPTLSRAISIVRALALFVLVFLLLRTGWLARPPAQQGPSRGGSVGAALGVGLILALMARPAAAAPPQDLLDELEERINEERPLAPSPDCGTDCALVNKLDVAVKDDELVLRAEVHMAGPGVWWMPGSIDTWIPRVVQVDGKPARAMAVYEDQLLLHLDSGLHEVELRGAVGADVLDLDLAGAPKHVVVEAEGWTVDGVDDDDLAESLSFQRNRGDEPDRVDDPELEPEIEDPQAAEAAPERRPRDMEPWFSVQRHIQIGPRWTVETTVTRLSHGPSPTKVHVPLLSGENMLEASGKVDDPKATVTLRAPGESITWTSVLEQSATVELAAPAEEDWTETWVISCAGAWQCSDEGTPATSDSGGTRVFHPWPGETLRLSLLEPSPAEGQILAVDRADLDLMLGETGTEARLTMKVRTATVAERTITLPSEAHLGSVRMDGNDVPMAKDATELRLTFQPGLHEVVIEFKLDSGAASVVRAPVVDLGGRAVNARVTFEYSDASDRVVVWTSGEGVGPMVWLWPYIGVLALLAVVLARVIEPRMSVHRWFLLNLGFSALFLPVVWLWFVLVGLRERLAERLDDPLRYNLAQLVVGLFTLTLVALVLATAKDLLTSPVSTIIYNGSDGSTLSWYADRTSASTPAATVVTGPLSLWRAIWAVWVVWLGWSCIAWGKWVWGVISKDGWWKSYPNPLLDEGDDVTTPEQPEPPVPATAQAQPTEVPADDPESKQPEPEPEPE